MKKVSRKELLKEQDEFTSLSARAILYFRENQKIFKVLGVIILAVVVAYMGYNAYFRLQNKRAQEAYNRAYYALAGQEAAEETREDDTSPETYFKEVVEDFGMSRLKSLASAELAYLKFRENAFDEALSHYQAFLQAIPEDSTYEPMARLALASCFEAKGEWTAGIDSLNALLSGPDDFFKEQALLNLARLYRRADREDKARETLKTYVETFGDSPFLSLAKAYLGE